MPPYEIKQHFVTFKSPGMATAEHTTKEITPGTRSRPLRWPTTYWNATAPSPTASTSPPGPAPPQELDSKNIAKSGTYFMGGKIQTLQEVMANPTGNKTLIENMKGNHWDQVVTVTKGHQWTSPILKDDAVLDMASL